MFGYLCLFQIIEVVKSKVCVYYISNYPNSYANVEYCHFGCCSKYTISPCCPSSYSSYAAYLDGISNYSYTFSTAETIGAVVGSLCGLAIFVSIICFICKRKRGQQGMPGQVLSQPAVAYVTTTNGAVASPYPQSPYQQHSSNMNIIGSTEQLNIIPQSNGNTSYPPSYDNFAHHNVKGSESSMNTCT